MPWQGVQQLRKSGQYEEALRVANEILQTNPHDQRTRSQAEWVYYDLIKAVVVKIEQNNVANRPVDSRDIDTLHEWLRGYANLKPEKRSQCFSLVLLQLVKIGQQLPWLMQFLQWCGREFLREDDFKPYDGPNGQAPSLAVKIAKAAQSWVGKHPDAEQHQIELAIDLVRLAQERALDADKIWLDWYLVKLLRRSGNLLGASEQIARVLKRKRIEHWAWSEAARIYVDEQPELAIACYCQALRLGAEPKYVGKVHCELAALLAASGDFAQATREALVAAENYDREGWKHPPELRNLLESEWYDPSLESTDTAGFYAEHAEDALALCFDRVAEIPATYLGMTEPRNGKKPKPRYAVRLGHHAESILGRRTVGRLKGVAPGSPLLLHIGIDADRTEVLDVLERSDGVPWDCTDSKEGVIYQFKDNRDSMLVYSNRDDTFRVYQDSWGESAAPVEGMGVRVFGALNPVTERFDVACLTPTALPNHPDIRRFAGELRPSERGFGFVDDVFVPPPLVATIPVTVRDCEGVAVMDFDKSKQKYGWRAVSIGAVK